MTEVFHTQDSKVRTSLSTVIDRVDTLDVSLFDEIWPGGTTMGDTRSLLALHAVIAARGPFTYLEVGSFWGRSMQAFIADPRCREITSIDRRDEESPDERRNAPEYPENTTPHMRERLSSVRDADLSKLITVDAGTDDVEPDGIGADICFIDAEHTNAAALRDGRFCRRAIGEHGVIVFHDRTLVSKGILQFLSELRDYRVYLLRDALAVVEIGVPTLIDDPRVRSQVPDWAVRVIDHPKGMELLLRALPRVGLARRTLGHAALRVGAPRRARHPTGRQDALDGPAFEICTFVTDGELYEQMRQSFVDAGFSSDAFIRLSDAEENPYSAISRIGRESTAQYPILCHQDVLVNQGVGARELRAALEQLDEVDPRWVVAGNAGMMRTGRMVRRVIDRYTVPTVEPLPLPVVTLDENFLVFNRRNAPRCSPSLSGFHFYGADACLHALRSGGSAYVIDFPVEHLGYAKKEMEYLAARTRFIEVWSGRSMFGYVCTPTAAMFVSRSKLLRRVFGSSLACGSVSQYCCSLEGAPLQRGELWATPGMAAGARR